ncbi:MAG: hypothetical protein NTX97_13340 [Bacteroidetes bacterium]|nr:hypothetical protein [Bacteroidota bacterium]
MKTAITITLLLITIAMLGQSSDGFISSKAYRLQNVINIENVTNDTVDYTDDFIKENGFIILMHYDNNEDIFSVDKGDSEHLMFIGVVKTENNLVEKDSMEYTTDGMARHGDSLQIATVTKNYIPNSFEDTGEKIYSFQLVFKDEIWNFIATEVITGKKDI